jgi:hypothetical protein
MSDSITLPVCTFENERWAGMSQGKSAVDVVAYHWKHVDDHFAFLGGHRHRRFRFWHNVHFRVPVEPQFNIAQVPIPVPPPVVKSRHGKRNQRS